MRVWSGRWKLGFIAAGLAVLSAVLVAVAWRPQPSGDILFHEVTAEAGITFQHTDGGCGHRHIMETVCCGLASFDYDGDGLIDIYFLNGAPLAGCTIEPPPRTALYRNLGGWRFVDVAAVAGVDGLHYGLGVTVGDYDNDGFPDLFLNNYGPNVLYRNNGDGTFSEVTEQAGLTVAEHVGAGACFLDLDGDGDLDLFAANYLEFSYDQHATTTIRGVPAYVSPMRYRPARSRLYRNEGDGTFTDVSEASGIGGHASWGMGTVCADCDNDGDTDIFVANDVAANFLFRNDGTGHFEEIAFQAGAAYDVYGNPQGSMGVECGDYDNDGWLDFYQTSYQLQHAVLYRNLGQGNFEDVSLTTGAGTGTYAHVTWGSGLIDFDNDGWRDLYIACGHLQDRVDEYDATTAYHARNVLLRNLGNGRFADVTERAGDGLQVRLSSRGAVFDDLDNDGRIDAVILNSRRESTMLRNATRTAHHWLQLELVGRHANRDGVGARVRVTAGDLVLIDEIHSGRSYQSHFGSRLHFGLGRHRRVDRIEVHWLGGSPEIISDVAVDQRVKIVEEQGISSRFGHAPR
jgi:hypothetical protein